MRISWMFIFDHAREMPGDHPHLYSFFKHENRFYRVKKGDLFAALQRCAHETGKIARLGPSKDHSSLKNAPEFDYSSFYVTTGTEHRLPCCAGFSLADQGSHSHPRGDFAPIAVGMPIAEHPPHRSR